MNYYFSSDWHLGHENIIKYDKRPFATVEEMNKAIIRNYNAIVTPEDEFYFLGDFAMGDKNKTECYLQQLNGKKFFIKGDHDKQHTIELFKKYGTYLGSKAEIEIHGQSITLCHFSLDVWNNSQQKSWHLFGHSHGNVPDNPNRLSFDIGINIWNYKPISFDEVKKRMVAKTFNQYQNSEI